MIPMNIRSKSYDPVQDLPRILDFLRKTFLETKSLFNYFPTNFENDKDNYPDGIRIWQQIDLTDLSKEPKIVSLTTPMRKFIYFIQYHTNYGYLLPEMVTWIINHSENVKEKQKSNQSLVIVSLEGNVPLEKTLIDHGFSKGENLGILRIRPLETPLHDYSLPDGFTIRSIKGEEEYDKYAKAIRSTFGHGDWFNAEVVKHINSATYYIQDLNFIVEAPNGDIASFCTFRMDPATRLTELEPMGTVPKYQKLGLGKALLEEGIKRLNKYNPSLLFIGGAGGAADNPGANRLYKLTGFTEKGKYYSWEKII